MSTTVQELSAWFDMGTEEGATHMIVVVDTYDYEDFPVFVMPSEDVKVVEARYNDPSKMSRVMEVYDLSKNKAVQMSQRRSFNY